MNNCHLGIYRGTVTDDEDPLGRMRIKAVVPVNSSTSGPWAESCMPPGNTLIPKVGEHVWIQFAGGDPSCPVWMGVIHTP